MRSSRNGKGKGLEERAEAFVRAADTPPASDRLKVYGMQRIMARAEAAGRAGELRGRKTYRNPSLTRRLILIGLLVPLTLVVLTSGSYAFSSGAQPSSRLYGTKLFFEHARLTLTPSPSRDLRLELGYSDLRLSELQKMITAGNVRGIDRWLQEYLRNIDDAYSLLDHLKPEEDIQLSRQFLDNLDRQAEVLNGIRGCQATPITQVDEAYGACNQGRAQVRQRCGTGEPGNSADGQMPGDENSCQGGNQGKGPEGQAPSQDNGQHMNQGGQDTPSEGFNQSPGPSVAGSGNGRAAGI